MLLIEELFDAALEHPEPGWRSFVEGRCPDDPTIRDEVLDLLSQHREAFSYFDRLAAEIAAASSNEIAAASGCWMTVGAYRTVRELGRGGMGTVFLGESLADPEAPPVAVKMIRRGFEDEAARRRFRTEREVLGRLDHPHIARLVDAGITDDGRPYLIMEHVDGPPITVDCDHRRLDVDRRLISFLAVADAVEYAHRRGVVHRDLKPRNVLVRSDGHPKLVDFGIAGLLQRPEIPEAGGERQPMTPAYASPEQLRGERVDAAADVYSLGLLLYELLCGRLPWDLKAASANELVALRRHTEPRPPSAWFLGGDGRSLGEIEELAARRGSHPAVLALRLASGLDQICARALASRPAERFPSVAMLAAELAIFLG